MGTTSETEFGEKLRKKPNTRQRRKFLFVLVWRFGAEWCLLCRCVFQTK